MRHRARRVTKIAVLFFLFAPIAIAVFGFVVMSLWNWLMPTLFHLPEVTFWQAIGLVLLSKILFGSFHGGQGHSERSRRRWRHRLWDRWEQMTPEEREQFRQKLRNRNWGADAEPTEHRAE